MSQKQLDSLLGCLVEIAARFEVNLGFRCRESNEALRTAIRAIDPKGCGFAKSSAESEYVVVECPSWNEKLWKDAKPYFDQSPGISGE